MNKEVMKECIRCWLTEKEIRKSPIICYVWWWSYPRHDYSKPIDFPKDWILFKKKLWNQ